LATVKRKGGKTSEGERWDSLDYLNNRKQKKGNPTIGQGDVDNKNNTQQDSRKASGKSNSRTYAETCSWLRRESTGKWAKEGERGQHRKKGF